MSAQETARDVDTVSAELIATGWACAWLYYAKKDMLRVREPEDILAIKHACIRATETMRMSLGNEKWSPGELELAAVMDAVISQMN